MLSARLFLPLLPLIAAAIARAPWRDATREEPTLGAGTHAYRWVSGWGALPEGMQLGNTHGCIATDSRGRIYLNTDTENSVVVLEPDGTFVGAWGKELAGGLHGMTIVREGEREVAYLAHTSRHQVIQTTLEGEVLWTLDYPASTGLYESAQSFNPTSVAVAPNGDFFVADGYGKSWIHKYDAQRVHLTSFGGPGAEPGKLSTPHGLMIDTRGDAPRLYVADRENHRLQIFDLEGKLLGVVEGDLRRPCNVFQRGSDIVVADLAGRVSIFDERDRLICHLGDNPDESKRAQNGIGRELWKDGEFIAPHAACWDARGDLYVVDWNFLGRVSKLARAAPR